MASDDNQKFILNPVKELSLSVFYCNQTQDAALQNSNILVALDKNLGEAIKYQKRIPLDYGSKFCDITGLTKLFSHN